MTIRAGHRRGRSLAAVAATALLALVSGCGGSSSGGHGGVDGSKIVLSVQNQIVPQFQQYAAAYEKAYPKRKVTVQSLPDDATQYVQQLVTARLGNKLPDVLMNVDYAANQLAAGNVTLDISDRLKKGTGGLKGSSFLPQFLGQYRPVNHPDQITGLPVSADSTTLFYNKTLFKKAGVTEYPKPTWTWDDLYRVATEIQKKSGGKFAGLFAPLGIGDQAAVYAPVIHAYGGYVYDPRTKKSGIGQPAAIQAWTQLLKAYGTASPKYSADLGSQPVFMKGRSAMAFSVRATVPATKEQLKDDWDTQVMPKINGRSTVGGGSYGLSISKGSHNQDAAWAFLAWFYDPNGGMKLAQATGQVVPPTQQGVNNGAWRSLPAPPTNEEAFAQDAKDAFLPPPLPGKAQKVLTDSVIKAVQQVQLQHRPVAAAFADAEKAVNQALQSATN
ncbi:ABC transporter substrate-binding protein [Actinomadura opuntiae]|uniref:ABC transporter substrate-binding protein n=1 Tax=Actinomadura sp. OS1-43 TaxID=604315 RepID=UPI00255ADC8F|nr:sugar ABC transporter substrate-binding protein [Actinomadura sp. OS1-43]MDL4821830.1 sugar ABC transporter substrate-binding protein [Actinomadura sp. OS1-43]